MRLAGYGFVVAAPEIYHRIEPAGTVLEFDDEGKRRGQADADATPVADFDDDIRPALDWLEADERVASDRLCATGTAPVATWRSAPRSTRACAPPHSGTRPVSTTAARHGRRRRLARARVRDSQGTLLIFGTNDPHTPDEGRAVIKRGLEEADANFRWSLYEAEHAFGRDIGPR